MKIYYVSSASGGPSFTTFQTPNGTSPVADSSSDTLNFTSSDNSITITGNSATDTIDFIVASAPTTADEYDIVTYTFFGGF